MPNTDVNRAAACFIASAVTAVQVVPALAQPVPVLRSLLSVRDRVKRPGSVALTFDDGPHPEGTPAVLGELERFGAQATFFVSGEQARRYPEIVAETAARGHEVALHCYRHRNLLRLSPAAVARDCDRGLEAIAAATDAPVRLYRPPYGVLTGFGLWASGRRGLETVLWTRWGRDWEGRATAESIAAKVAAGVTERDVLLLHDADHYSAPGSWRRTVRALPRVLETLAQRDLVTTCFEPFV